MPAQRDRTVIVSPQLWRLQRRHFVLYDVLPGIGTLVAVALAWVHPIGAVELGLFLSMWLLTGLGLTVGYHRLFAHRAFVAGSKLSVALVAIGSMAGRGPMLSWVAMHRRHHELSDRAGDLHSPNLHGQDRRGRVRGWLHAHLTWMIRHDYPNVVHYASDLLRDRALVWANHRYRLWVGLGLALPAVFGAGLAGGVWGALDGVLWGGAVRLFAVAQAYSLINSLCHMRGARPFPLRHDRSGNLGLLGLLAWGEGWHNNHHAFPYSAAFGLGWRQPDPGFWLICGLRRLGLAQRVRVPGPTEIAQRQAALAAAATGS